MSHSEAMPWNPVGPWPLTAYFLKLGAIGFGGPAMAGQMQRDLQERNGWITRDEYQDGLTIAQTMPGPLVAQLVMCIGFIRHGVLGATLVGAAFVLPSFILMIVLAALYVAFEGLPQIHSLSYGIGAAIVAIIALAAWRLARSTDGRDVRLWMCSAVVMGITVATRVNLAWLFLLAGALGMLAYAPSWLRRAVPPQAGGLAGLLPLPISHFPALAVPIAAGGTLVVLTLFFLKAAAFNFSGLPIVPFLHEGMVVNQGWLNEREFRDAVAIGMITPGPTVIGLATFMGYLVAGVGGAALATLGVSVPVWVFNVALGRLFLRHRDNPQVRGFVKGVTAAAVGAIAGAAVVLGPGAISDVWTATIFLGALAALYFRQLREPAVVGLAGLAGLLAFPR